MVSKELMTFMKETSSQQKTWEDKVLIISEDSAMGDKTIHLCFLSVYSSVGFLSDIAYQAECCIKSGVTNEEVISSFLIGLSVVGKSAVETLPIALKVYDEMNRKQTEDTFYVL
jgi:alkylhydroperoxidase/carboxymuconolactone decarboxylase family protein YurZ